MTRGQMRKEEHSSKRKVELLAPGGSMEAILAAVNAGADAVYAGGRAFGARAFAMNPDTEGLLEAIDYCHLHSAKFYLTVNTLLKEKELTDSLEDFITPVFLHGVDAVLVQDFGVFRFLRRRFPALPVHASTQMTVTGIDGVKLLEEMGAERVVLSRELSLPEIAEIGRQCSAELETFVHGALCYCYSGKCLMSSMIGGRSGNRGRCAQPCRLPYDLYASLQDKRNGRTLNRPGEQYLLSPKDICTLHLIPDLIDAGIASLKIEGRMKSSEYAAGVTAMYRKYIDLYLNEGREAYFVEPEDEELLTELFSRGEYSEGYYHEKSGRDMIVLTEQKKEKGESLKHSQDTVRRIHDRYVTGRRTIPLKASAVIRSGAQMELKVCDRFGHSAAARGDVPSPAQSRPADPDSVKKQIDKTGNTDFAFESIDIDLDEGLFVPVKSLNELRRQALDLIREEILKPYRREDHLLATQGETERSESSFECSKDIFFTPALRGVGDSGSDEVCYGEVQAEKAETASPESGDGSEGLSYSHPSVTSSVRTQEQLEEVLSFGKIGGIYLEHSICTKQNVKRVRRSGKKVYLMLPPVWRKDTAFAVRRKLEAELGGFGLSLVNWLDGIVAGSFDQLYALKNAGLLWKNGFEIIADAGLYSWNREAARMLSSLGVTSDTLPYECSVHELSDRGCGRSECVIYGYLPLMVSAQCLTKTTTGCRHESALRWLKDRKGVLFPVLNDCGLCLNTIYNSVPLELLTLQGQVKGLGCASFRYSFTVESAGEVRRILKGELPDEVTRGHFRKGAE